MEGATFAMDMFSLGRLLHFMAARDGSLWAGRDYDLTMQEKEGIILDMGRELEVGPEVEHEVARRMIMELTRKDPLERMTLQKLKVSSLWFLHLGHWHIRNARLSLGILIPRRFNQGI